MPRSVGQRADNHQDRPAQRPDHVVAGSSPPGQGRGDTDKPQCYNQDRSRDPGQDDRVVPGQREAIDRAEIERRDRDRFLARKIRDEEPFEPLDRPRPPGGLDGVERQGGERDAKGQGPGRGQSGRQRGRRPGDPRPAMEAEVPELAPDERRPLVDGPPAQRREHGEPASELRAGRQPEEDAEGDDPSGRAQALDECDLRQQPEAGDRHVVVGIVGMRQAPR